MSFNGSGVFNINTAGQPVVPNTLIDATVFNALTADVGTGLSTTITKDGQSTPTANIPMGGFKLTGLGSGTLAADAINYAQLGAAAGSSFNVQSYGAIPDNVLIDNAPFILDAMSAATDSDDLGATVIFPTGIYYVATEMAPNFQIQGQRWIAQGFVKLQWNGATDATKAIFRASITPDTYFAGNFISGIQFNADAKAGFCFVITQGATPAGSGSQNYFQGPAFMEGATVANLLIGDNAEPHVNDVDSSNNVFDQYLFYNALYNVKINAPNALLQNFTHCVFGQTGGNGITKQHARIYYGGNARFRDCEFTPLDRYTAGFPNGTGADVYAVWCRSGGLIIDGFYAEETRILYYSSGSQSFNNWWTVKNGFFNDSRASANLANAIFINNVNGYGTVEACAPISSAGTARLLVSSPSGTVITKNVDMGSAGWVVSAIASSSPSAGRKNVIEGLVPGDFNTLVPNWNFNKWQDLTAANSHAAFTWGNLAGPGATVQYNRETTSTYTGGSSLKVQCTVAGASGINGIRTLLPIKELNAVTVIAAGFLSSGALSPLIQINGTTGQIGTQTTVRPSVVLGAGYYDFVTWAEANLEAQADGQCNLDLGLVGTTTGTIYFDSIVVIPAFLKPGCHPALLHAMNERRWPTEVYGIAAPSGAANAWKVGDTVWQITPVVGQPLGWKCTVAGTPGTWVALANL